MNSLHGVKLGLLSDETKKSLLEGTFCIDKESNNEVIEGECVIELTDTLSVDGRVLNGKVVIDDESIIYYPSKEITLKSEEDVFFEINEVMTVSEASELWSKSEGTIRAAIKSKKFIPGVDYRKAGRITLITRSSMKRVYGEPKQE